MIWSEAPGQTQDGRDDGDGLVCLEDGQVSFLAKSEYLDVNFVMVKIFNKCWEEEIQLNCWLKWRLQTDFHYSCGRIKNFWRFNFLLSRNFLCPFSEIIFSIIVIFDEENCKGPQSDTTEERQGVKDEAEVTSEYRLDPGAPWHFLDDLGALHHQGLVVTRREKLVYEEGPWHKDEEEGVAKLGLRVHTHGVAVEADVVASWEVLHADFPALWCPDPVVVSVTRLDVWPRVLRHGLHPVKGLLIDQTPTWKVVAWVFPDLMYYTMGVKFCALNQ